MGRLYLESSASARQWEAKLVLAWRMGLCHGCCWRCDNRINIQFIFAHNVSRPTAKMWRKHKKKNQWCYQSYCLYLSPLSISQVSILRDNWEHFLLLLVLSGEWHALDLDLDKLSTSCIHTIMCVVLRTRSDTAKSACLSHWDTVFSYRGVLFSVAKGSVEKWTDRPTVKILFYSELWCKSVRWPTWKLWLNLVGLQKRVSVEQK